jgi:hypothetical protein
MAMYIVNSQTRTLTSIFLHVNFQTQKHRAIHHTLGNLNVKNKQLPLTYPSK